MNQAIQIDEKEDRAKAMIESLTTLQEHPSTDGYLFPCPRCGHDRMDRNPVRNALSRRANVYICNTCGREEAIMDMKGIPPLPFSEWAMPMGLANDGGEEYDDEDDEEGCEE